jgi:hypothetical protein
MVGKKLAEGVVEFGQYSNLAANLSRYLGKVSDVVETMLERSGPRPRLLV